MVITPEKLLIKNFCLLDSRAQTDHLMPIFKLEHIPIIEASNEDPHYACNAGDLGSVPVLGRHPGEGNGYPV